MASDFDGGLAEFQPSAKRPKQVETIDIDTENHMEVIPAEPNIRGCRDVSCFEFVAKLGDGTYGIVSKVRDKKTKKEYAMKGIKMDPEMKEGFPLQSLREIKTLQLCRHPNVVSLEEILVGNAGMNVYLIMEYVENDIHSLLENREKPFTISETKCLLQQLLAGVAHLHEHWVIHRDIKPANLLMSNQGILKLADFGLAREYGSPLEDMTAGVVTLRYRAPEVLLGGSYTTAVDVWSCGCIFAEFLTKASLFAGHNELGQIDKIFKTLGTPSDRIWPGFSKLPALKSFSFVEQPFSTLKKALPMLSDSGFQLIKSMFVYDPSRRISAADALKHPYFSEPPLPMDPALMPTHRPKVEGKLDRSAISSILQQPPSSSSTLQAPPNDRGSIGFASYLQ
jgi:cell division cycle 2-like protein